MRRSPTGRGTLGAHLLMVLHIGWQIEGLRFRVRLVVAVRGAFQLRLAGWHGGNTSRRDASHSRCSESTGGGLGIRRRLASRLIAAGALSCAGDMWALTYNALGRAGVVFWGVGKSALGAALGGCLGVRTHILAMACPPACRAGLSFAAKRSAAVGGGAVAYPKRNPRALEENLSDVRSV